jgi:hypothetical protein
VIGDPSILRLIRKTAALVRVLPTFPLQLFIMNQETRGKDKTYE